MRRPPVGTSPTLAVQPSEPNTAERIVAPVRQLCRQLMPAVLGMVAAACDARQPLAPVTSPFPEQARPALGDPVGEFSASGFLTSPGETTGGTGGSMDWTNLGIAFNKDMWIRVRTSGTVTYTINPAARVTPCGYGCTHPRPLYGEGAAGGAGIGNTHKLRVSMSVGVLPGIGYSERLPRAYGENQLEWVVPVKAGWDLRANRFGLPGGPHCTNNCDPPYPQVGWYLLSGGTTFQVEEVVPLQVAPRQLEVARGDSVTFDAVAIEGTTKLRWYFGDSRSAGRVWACDGQTTCTVAVPKNSLMSVYGDYAGVTSFHARAEEVRVVDALLTLQCTPNPVVRGSTINCGVTSTPSEMTDVSWSFTDRDGRVIPGPQGPRTWDGTMVVGGTMHVSAVAGGDTLSKDTLVTVEARRWPRITVRGIDGGHGDLPDRPRHIHDLAHMHPPAPPAPWDVVSVSEGPNTGWAYLRSIATEFGADLHINSGFQPGTPFYNMQAPGIDPVTGDPFCRKSQMAAVERGAREHEGLISSPSTSHLEVFQRWFRNNAPQDSLENVTVFVPALPYSLNDFVDAEYSKMVATPAVNDPNQHHTSDVPPGLVPFPTVPCRPRLYP